MTATVSDPLDIEAVRQAFPILQDVVYLNVGTYGLMPEPALAAYLAALAEFERSGVASTGNVGGRAEETRQRIAALLGATPDEIGFTRNATDGINLVLAGLDWLVDDEVITTDEEHEAMIHPLLYLQRRRGIRVRRVPVSADPDAMLAHLAETVSDRTRLVAMSHVTCETGTRLPVRAIAHWAAERGIRTLFDGAQAVGAFAVDVNALGCDFYTSNGHKWLGGPKGSGLFWAKRARMGELSPAHVGAGSLEQVDVASGTADPWPSALRFEFGTRTHAIGAGLGASLDWLAGLGWDKVEQHIAAMSAYLKEAIQARPNLHLMTPPTFAESSGLTTFTVAGHNAGELLAQLRQQRIYGRHIPHYNAMRIATAHFTSRADIDCLMEALDVMTR